MIPEGIKRWLKDHGKGDLQECTFEEIQEALKCIGRSCPIAEVARKVK